MIIVLIFVIYQNYPSALMHDCECIRAGYKTVWNLMRFLTHKHAWAVQGMVNT